MLRKKQTNTDRRSQLPSLTTTPLRNDIDKDRSSPCAFISNRAGL